MIKQVQRNCLPCVTVASGQLAMSTYGGWSGYTFCGWLDIPTPNVSARPRGQDEYIHGRFDHSAPDNGD
ncbi:hypothetical protein VTN49DRAFT_6257 [Thermomyces lanuginosus]|uniref:uncharacterized protein n=1 Tax=Thermomyces lanuginosus TaxID=5541 RepID=UPI0037425166